MKKFGGWAALALVSLLSACGGGGGDSPPPPPANVAPAITTQPASVSVTSGQSATFSVVATGTPAPSYQWRRDGAAISGATSASYTIATTAVGDSGAAFSVVVTNAAGSVTSNNATLTVTPANVAPAITTQPASVSVISGQSATFTVVATGTPAPTYQWRRDGTAISGATSASYSIATTALGDTGAAFSVVVTNTAGSVTSSNATLTVTAASVAPAITTQPASATRVDGGTAPSFSVVATGSPTPTYQWRKNGTNISGATSASYTVPGGTVSLADTGATYSVVVTNTAGTVTSNNATLTVTPIATAITTHPADQTAVDGDPATFTVAATGSASLAYQWQLEPSGGGGFTNIVGATGSSYNLATVALGNNGEKYRVQVSGPGGTVTSNAATLSVSLIAPMVTTHPVSQAVDQDDPSPTFTVVASGSATLAFQWRRNGANIPGANAASYSGAATALANNGDQFDVIVSNDGTLDDDGTDVTSNIATLTVTQTRFAPTITTQPSSVSALEGDAVNFTVVAGGGPPAATYQWQRDAAGAPATFSDIGGATGATYSPGAALFANNGDQFRVVVSNSEGSVTSSAVTLNVTQTAMTLIAGFPGNKGNVNAPAGPPTSARFSYPTDVAYNAAGDIFVADFGNQTIRRITAAGFVTTLAGTAGAAGSDDATGTNAKFNNPAGVVEVGGVVYVADQGNNRIRAINVTTGVVTTIAGGPTAGSADNATGTSATFTAPTGLAATATALYVAEFGSNKIRKVDLSAPPAYAVTTVAGTGTAGSTNGTLAASTFSNPAGVAVDPGATAADTDDILYVTDTSNALIRKIDVTGNAVTTVAGLTGNFGGNDGDAATARFGTPRDIAFVTGALYVSDPGTHTVRKVDLVAGSGSATFVTTLAGASGQVGTQDGSDAAARFSSPYGISINAAGTTLAVSNFGSDVISKITIGTAAVDADFAGATEVRGHADNANGTLATFSYPRGIVTDATGVSFVADSLNNSIRRIAANGAVTLYAGDPTQTGGYAQGDRLTGARFNDPRDVAIGAAGILYVADRSNDAIRRIDGNTGLVTTIADGSDGISVPDALVATAAGIVYVANTGGSTILKIDTNNSNAVTVLAGSGVPGHNDATGALAQFNRPNGIALVGTTLYVADGFNFAIRAVDVGTGAVTTIAGDVGNSGAAENANGLLAQFGSTGPLISDGSNLYMVDYINHTVRKIGLSVQHPVSTVVGTGAAGVQYGALPGGLNGPTGISFATGVAPGVHLRVTDGVEHVILGIVLAP